MHFLNWILEQQESPGEVGLFGTIIYNDINNGCGMRFTEPMEWQDHFNDRHKKTAKVLNSLLLEAYVGYRDSFNADKL